MQRLGLAGVKGSVFGNKYPQMFQTPTAFSFWPSTAGRRVCTNQRMDWCQRHTV